MIGQHGPEGGGPGLASVMITPQSRDGPDEVRATARGNRGDQPFSPGPPHVTHDHLRRLLRRQANTVVVVTAVGAERPVGFTATTFTPVSMRPPLVSFCLHRASSSWPTFESAAYVAVHMLMAGQVDVAKTFAARGIDRFAVTAWRPGPFDLPILDEALAWLACRVANRIAAGDHTIVLAAPMVADYVDGVPLIYHDGAYSHSHRP